MRLAELLECEMYSVSEKSSRGIFKILLDMIFDRTPRINPIDLDFNTLDHIIFCAPVWNMRIAHPMKSFLKKYTDQLPSFSFATLCIGGRKAQQSSIEEQLFAFTGQRVFCVKQFEINKLILTDEKDEANQPTGYKVTDQDMETIEADIQSFVQTINRQ